MPSHAQPRVPTTAVGASCGCLGAAKGMSVSACLRQRQQRQQQQKLATTTTHFHGSDGQKRKIPGFPRMVAGKGSIHLQTRRFSWICAGFYQFRRLQWKNWGLNFCYQILLLECAIYIRLWLDPCQRLRWLETRKVQDFSGMAAGKGSVHRQIR